MVNICSIKSCRNIGKDGVHMHKFPSNEQAAVIWTNIIKKIQPSYMPLKTSMICGAHFQSSDYNLNCKKIRLNDNAVPSIFLTTSRKSLMKIFEDLPKDINIDIPKYLQYDGHKIHITTEVKNSILNTSEYSEASTNIKYNLSTTSDNTKVNETISNTAECSEASTSLKYNLSTSDTFSVLGVADNMLASPLLTRTKRKAFIRDFNENDLDTSRKRKKYWNTSQRTFNKYKRKVKSLENQNQYLRNKIKNVKQLISHLQKTNKMSDECYSIIKVFFNAKKKKLSKFCTS